MASRRYEDSLIATISRQFFNDTLLLEAATRFFLVELDYYYYLKCEYDLTDALKATLMYNAFFGEEDGAFGQYNRNDQFVGKLKYSF